MTDYDDECSGECVEYPHDWTLGGAGKCRNCGQLGTGDPCGDGDCPGHPDNHAAQFLAQNPIARETLTLEDVTPHADHHAGGLVVLFGYAPSGECVKCHDSWADDETVVVHQYDPDDDEDSHIVSHYKTGRDALAAFLKLIGE